MPEPTKPLSNPKPFETAWIDVLPHWGQVTGLFAFSVSYFWKNCWILSNAVDILSGCLIAAFQKLIAQFRTNGKEWLEVATAMDLILLHILLLLTLSKKVCPAYVISYIAKSDNPM